MPAARHKDTALEALIGCLSGWIAIRTGLIRSQWRWLAELLVAIRTGLGNGLLGRVLTWLAHRLLSRLSLQAISLHGALALALILTCGCVILGLAIARSLISRRIC